MYFYKQTVNIDVLKKNQVRKSFLEKRKNLSKTKNNQNNSLIQASTINLIKSLKPKSIHCFLPILSQNEIDTFPIIKFCWENQIIVIASVSDFSNFKMKSFVLTSKTIIKISKNGIPEPLNAESYNDKNIDVILTPLIAFDELGNRVGYGKGFYDRFFKNCKPNVNKVGLSHFNNTEIIDDIHPNDIKLNYCITPNKTIIF